jgi:hypothetical protein
VDAAHNIERACICHSVSPVFKEIDACVGCEHLLPVVPAYLRILVPPGVASMLVKGGEVTLEGTGCFVCNELSWETGGQV